jgi:cobalt/nickel transport system permease protein
MHIPNSMLQGSICPFTAIISAIGIAIVSFFAVKAKNKPTAGKFAAVTALIFAGQMMNFPIQDGTSGHLIGGVIAASLLGIPFGILAMSLVVTIQCLFFSDGGFLVLGANLLNMAFIGAGVGGFLKVYFSKFSRENKAKEAIALGFAAWLSVMLAALACSVELSVSGTIAFSKVIPAMLGTHSLVGIGEGLITIAVCFALSSEAINVSKKRSATVPLVAAGIIAFILSPFASSYPDGLEWVAGKYHFLHESAPTFVSPLPDYAVPFISTEALSTGLAGIIGVVLTFSIAWVIAKILTSKKVFA